MSHLTSPLRIKTEAGNADGNLVMHRASVSFSGRSPLLIGIGLILLALLGAFAYLLLDSQARVRSESQKRFQTRAVVSAALTESLFSSAGAAGQKDASKRFGGPTVSAAALDRRVKEEPSQKYLMVFDGKGNLIGASSKAPGSAGRKAEGAPPHVRQALKGQAHLSEVISRPNQPDIIEWALPYKTRFGMRILVSGGRAKPFISFLAAYLARARETASMDAFVVERSGEVVANAVPGGRRPKQLSPDLAAALQRGPRGTFGQNDAESYFASTPVKGSSWRVVLSEPTHDLYPILAKGRTWLLWAVFAAFAIVAAVSLVLLRRLFRSADEVTKANVELTERQRELAATNESLAQQTKIAQEASRAKSDFLANMSHELRTPLTSMIGYSELMAGDHAGGTDDERKKFLGVVVSNGRHLEELIDGILDLSKVEAGKMDFHPERVDLPELIDELITDMQVWSESKRIELVADVDSEVQFVRTDPTRLKQVLFNYLSNALKFTPDGGRVEIHMLPEGSDHFRLVVKDNGIGIAWEDQEKLFQHFQQVGQTAQEKHQGTGLGLSLVKRLVEAQGGKVGLQSERGQGSAFYAVLPRDSRSSSTLNGAGVSERELQEAAS